MLTYLLARPNGWQASTTHLQKISGDGRDRIRRIVRELESAGYLVTRKERGPDGRIVGTFRDICEEPFFWQKPRAWKPALQDLKTPSLDSPGP